ncbi:ABC transporter [Serratia sp. NPDC078593]|uniref:ABC transporter n=1 Tax=unclassified Serratia (in: enterobacteria) TaxID=2647522 RepID=UPI0037D311BB
MRFFAVWVYLTWRNSINKAAHALYGVRRLQSRFACFLLQYVNYRWILALVYAGGILPFSWRGLKRRGKVAAANKQSLIGAGKRLDYTRLIQRRHVLELAATYGKNPQVLAQLECCRQQLNAVVEPLHQAGSPVILAPLHMVSDVLAGIVGGGVFPGQATVIVSSSAEIYQEQARKQGGVNLSYCSIHDDNRAIAGNLTSAIMEAAEHKRNIIIFPDITPDYTVGTNKAGSAKLSCRLFDRSAHVHSGVIRLAKALSAQVVFYNLYYDKEIKIHIYPTMAAKELKTQLPEMVEQAIKQYPQDWLLWHAHSLFFINE